MSENMKLNKKVKRQRYYRLQQVPVPPRFIMYVFTPQWVGSSTRKLAVFFTLSALTHSHKRDRRDRKPTQKQKSLRKLRN